MAVKTPVFNRYDSVGHIIRQFRKCHRIAKECALLGNFAAIAGEDHDTRFTLGNLKQAFLVQRKPGEGDEAADSNARPKTQGKQQPENPADETLRPFRWRAFTAPTGRRRIALKQARLGAPFAHLFFLAAK